MQTSVLAVFGADSRGITIFGFEIYYYALCIVTGIIVATVLSALLMKRRNMSPDFIFTLFIFCIPMALICARLFYCITDGMDISKWFSWQSIRSGGLSIIGGVIGGVGTGLVVCLVKKVDFFRAADCVVINILLAQAIGRWGNYFNQEVYGGVVTNAALQWFPMAVKIGSTWHYALFFYEGCINFIGWALLYFFAWRWNKKPNGVFTFAYFVWYGTVRAIMEPLRDSSYILGDGIMWSELFAILLLVMGVVGIAVLLALNYKKEGSLFGSKKGDPCGITAYLTPYKDDEPYYSKINMLGANYPPAPEKVKDERTLGEKFSDWGKGVAAWWNKLIAKLKGEEEPKDKDETDVSAPNETKETQKTKKTPSETASEENSSAGNAEKTEKENHPSDSDEIKKEEEK